MEEYSGGSLGEGWHHTYEISVDDKGAGSAPWRRARRAVPQEYWQSLHAPFEGNRTDQAGTRRLSLRSREGDGIHL